LIEQASTSRNSNPVNGVDYKVFSNKKSKMHDSILVHHQPENKTYSLHAYALIVTPKQNDFQGNIVDLRKSAKRDISNPFKVIADQRQGSLSFSRYFIKNPDEKKYLEKLKEKYPDKKNITSKKYFPSLLLLVAHYCDHYCYSNQLSKEQIEIKIQESLIDFDQLIQEDIHQTLRTIGKPLYLKGLNSIINYHISREIPEIILKTLTDDKKIHPTTKQYKFSRLIPPVEGMRKEMNEQEPLFNKYPEPSAITQIVQSNDMMLPIFENRFPIVIVGEPEIRRNVVLNLLNTANARFLIFDPSEDYGRLAMINPRIRGFLLGSNYLLNIINTEGTSIREQVYAYWFSKIIGYIAGLRTELEKTLETYLLGVYRDPNNKSKTELRFQRFANQEITSEVTKMGRNEASTITNVLYPLGTYQEISIMTRVGRTQSLETLFESKGSILQFSKDDDQLTKISYLFTLLKLRSIQNDDPKILVLENLDNIITDERRQDENLSNLILGLMEKYHLIIGIRSPSKIKELFKNTRTKIINRLKIYEDQKLLEKEFNFSNRDIQGLNKLTDREFQVLLPEFAKPNLIKISPMPESKMRIIVDEYEKQSSLRILQSDDYLRKDGIPPEIRKALFSLIHVLKEKPKKMLPIEGIEKIIRNVPEVDIIRAKEIAKAEAFVKVVESSSDDSEEVINLFKLTEIGEEFYNNYLALQERIPAISLTSLATEKDFEKKIYSILSNAKDLIENLEYSEAIDKMLDIATRLLAILPENERFMTGKNAALLLDHWSNLSTLKEVGFESKVENYYQEFSQLVTNALKTIKHTIIDGGGITVAVEKERIPLEKSVKEEKKIRKSKKDDDEYEFDFDIFDDVESSNKNQKAGSRKEQLEVDDTATEDSSSKFLAATDDLRSAGMSHIDSNGEIFSPKKKKKSIQSKEKIIYDPFEPESDEKSVIDIYFEQQKESVETVKELLMKNIAKNLAVSEIDDEEFIWHCLASRFNGKLEDGYTISEVVTTIKRLTKDVQQEALISEETIKRLEKLIKNPKLMDEKLINDLKQYIEDK